jgi:nucleoside-diphosphate-sugar epimerase
MIVAVTGASGLLGRAIVDALMAAGHAVTGIDAVPATTAATARLVADLRDLGDTVLAFKGAEAVIHAAAIPRPTGRTAREVFATNMALMFNAVEAAATLGIHRFVYASSFSVLGFPFNVKPVDLRYLPVDEAHPVGPQDAYAVSKWLGEEMVEAAVRRGAFSAVSLRMPWIQGPATFMKEVGPRRLDREGSGRDLWSYIDSRDAAAGFLAALTAPVTGHLRLFLSAADTYSETPTADLVRHAYPNVALRKRLGGHASVIDTSAAHAALGFAPKHSWRDY